MMITNLFPKTIADCRTIVLFVIVNLSFVSVIEQPLFAYHGKEISIKFNNGQFLFLPSYNVQQIKFTTTYSVSDSNIIGKQIGGVMKLYSENGTLIKTSSIPNGFIVGENGFEQFVTSLPNNSISSINAVVVFTDLNNTSALSNSITEKLILNRTG